MTDIKEIYVSQREDAEFCEVMQALEYAKQFDGMEVYIHIEPGVYRERIVVSQDHISFIGKDAENTVLVYGDAAVHLLEDGDKRGTFRTPSVFIDANHFKAINITFQNDAGQGEVVGQALALYADGDQLIFENCRFDGHQDTIFTAPLPLKEMQPGGFKGPKEFAPRVHGRHYYKDCYIAGNIDFIFGSATAFFENCEIFMKNREGEPKGFVAAPSTYEDVKYGYVFNRCRFTSDCPRESGYLGRPWRDHAKCVILNSEIGPHIKKEGWDDWKKTTFFFAEYGNYGEGASIERAPFVKMLTEAEAAEYTKENVLNF